MTTKLMAGIKDWRVWVVTLYTFFAFSWSMPADRMPFKARFDRIASPIFIFLNLWQGWDMFAPDPRKEDIFVEVFYKNNDGTSARFALSRMLDFDYFERWQKERWRKFFNDHLRLDSDFYLWLPYAQFTHRQLLSKGIDPVEIHLIRHWRDSVTPVSPSERADVSQRPWESYVFFKWVVPNDRRVNNPIGSIP